MTSSLRKLLRLNPKVHSIQKYLDKELEHECTLAVSVLHKKVTPDMNHNILRSLAPVPLDPYKVIAEDLRDFNSEIVTQLHSSVDVANLITGYYFNAMGKQIRPVTMLLLARALSHSGLRTSTVLPAQRVYAQVMEVIHTASLVHDDVVDKGETRRGQSAVHRVVGNRLAVLGGDYMISGSSYLLSHVGDMRLMDLFSRIIENLGRGELIQADIKNSLSTSEDELLFTYTQKTFCKTASLIAYGCKGIGLLAQESFSLPCYEFGKHLGLAFQYVDDILDFVSDSKTLGKPALNDMREGLATAPVLLALPEYPEVRDLINREFKGEGDVEQGLAVARSVGLERTRHLALLHLRKALDSLTMLPHDSKAVQALGSLARLIYERVK